jgi:hypothetical protein
VGVAAWVLLIAVPVACFLGVLAMQRDKKRTKGRGTASRVMRAGFLEMQGLLEPEKKVEILKQEQRDDLAIVVDPSGEPPAPGGPKS